jgi:hypothetical protein
MSRAECGKLRARVHWQHFMAKMWSISLCDIALLTCLGNLGQHNTDRIISICVLSSKVAKAIIVVTILCDVAGCFNLNLSQWKYRLSVAGEGDSFSRGARKLAGESLKPFWAEFSTIS